MLELLYSPIISAICNVVDFMASASESGSSFVSIALGFAAFHILVVSKHE
ncbi:MAG: hypothetical protein J6Y04_03835 [Bacteroidaceae bacterium]|nr:hypothetical protein [Bacteroidaceae bacterium]